MNEKVKRDKKYYLQYILIYTMLFAVISTGVFFSFILHNKSFLWKSDGLSLYIPKAYYFIKEVHTFFMNLIHGKVVLPMYDFSYGMGDATPIHFEPLYWLYVLFSENNVEIAFDLLFFLRFYLAGLSMSAFILYFKNDRPAALLGSFAYIYTEFSLEAASRHSQFVVPMIMLPLGLLVMEEILKKRRWYLCTLFVWIHLWCGFYYLYMNTIAMGVYFLVRFFANPEGRDVKNFFRKGFTIAFSYLLGVMLGNIVLLNTFASYLSSSRSLIGGDHSNKLKNVFLYSGTLGRTYKLLRCFLTDGRPLASGIRLGYTPLVFLAIMALFFYRGQIQRKIFILLTVACCFVPLFPYIFSGFDSTTYRWSYIMAFVLAANLAFVCRQMFRLDKKRLYLLCASVVPFLLLYVYDYHSSGKMTVLLKVTISAASILITVLALIAVNWIKMSDRRKFVLFLAVQAIALWGLGAQQFAPSMGELVTEFADKGAVLSSAQSTPLKISTEIEDDTFFRTATNESRFSIVGTALMLGYNSTVYDQNTVSKIWQKFYGDLGLSQWTLVRKRGFNGRAFLENLASVKYYIIKENQERDVPYGYEYLKDIESDGTNYKIYESQNVLPIGYTYSDTISREEYEKYSSVEKQEVLLQTAVVEDNAESSVTPQITSEQVKILDITCTNAEIDGDTIKLKPKNGENARIEITFEPQKDVELYLCLNDMHRTGNQKDNIWYGTDDYKEKYLLHGVSNSYYTDQEDYVFPLGYCREEVSSCYITTDTKMTLSCKELGIYVQNMSNLESYTEKLKENVLENVSAEDNHITGDISLKEDKLLVLSVPYRNGWNAYVDGVKTEIERVNTLYMGMRLSAGDHKIELKYQTPGLRYSLVVFAAALILYLILTFKSIKSEK